MSIQKWLTPLLWLLSSTLYASNNQLIDTTEIRIPYGPRTLHITQQQGEGATALLIEHFEDGYRHETLLPVYFAHNVQIEHICQLSSKHRHHHALLFPTSQHPKGVFIGNLSSFGLQGGGNGFSSPSPNTTFDETFTKTKKHKEKLQETNQTIQKTATEIEEAQQTVLTYQQQITDPNRPINKQLLHHLLQHTRHVDNMTQQLEGLQQYNQQLYKAFEESKKKLKKLQEEEDGYVEKYKEFDKIVIEGIEGIKGIKGVCEIYEVIQKRKEEGTTFIGKICTSTALSYLSLMSQSLFVATVIAVVGGVFLEDKALEAISAEKVHLDKIEELTTEPIHQAPCVPRTPSAHNPRYVPTQTEATHQRLEAIDKRRQELLATLQNVDELIEKGKNFLLHHKACQSLKNLNNQQIKYTQRLELLNKAHKQALGRLQQEIDILEDEIRRLADSESISNEEEKKMKSLVKLIQQKAQQDKEYHRERRQLQGERQKCVEEVEKSYPAIAQNTSDEQVKVYATFVTNLIAKKKGIKIALQQLQEEKKILTTKLSGLDEEGDVCSNIYNNHTIKQLTNRVETLGMHRQKLQEKIHDVQTHLDNYYQLLEDESIQHHNVFKELLKARSFNLQCRRNSLALEEDILFMQQDGIERTIRTRVARGQTAKTGLFLLGFLGANVLLPGGGTIMVSVCTAGGVTLLSIGGQKLVENDFHAKEVYQELDRKDFFEISTEVGISGITTVANQYVTAQLPDLAKFVGSKVLSPEQLEQAIQFFRTLQITPTELTISEHLLGRLAVNFIQELSSKAVDRTVHYTNDILRTQLLGEEIPSSSQETTLLKSIALACLDSLMVASAGALLNKLHLFPTEGKFKRALQTGVVEGSLAMCRQGCQSHLVTNQPNQNTTKKYCTSFIAGFIGGFIGHVVNHHFKPTGLYIDEDSIYLALQLEAYQKKITIANYSGQLASFVVGYVTNQDIEQIVAAASHQANYALRYEAAQERQFLLNQQQENYYDHLYVYLIKAILLGEIIIDEDGNIQLPGGLSLDQLQEISEENPEFQPLYELLTQPEITLEEKRKLLQEAIDNDIFDSEEEIQQYGEEIIYQAKEVLHCEDINHSEEDAKAIHEELAKIREIAQISLDENPFMDDFGSALYEQLKQSYIYIVVNGVRVAIISVFIAKGAVIGARAGACIGGGCAGPQGAAVGGFIGGFAGGWAEREVAVFALKKTVEYFAPAPGEEGWKKTAHDIFVKTPTPLESIPQSCQNIYKTYQKWHLLEPHEKRPIKIQAAAGATIFGVGLLVQKGFNKVNAPPTIPTTKRINFQPAPTYQVIPCGNTLQYVQATPAPSVLKIPYTQYIPQQQPLQIPIPITTPLHLCNQYFHNQVEDPTLNLPPLPALPPVNTQPPPPNNPTGTPPRHRNKRKLRGGKEEEVPCSKEKEGDSFKIPKKISNKVPRHWISKSAKKNNGTIYKNPKKPEFDHIRFMKRNLDSRAPVGQKKPYFIRSLDGKVLTKHGNWIVPNKTNHELYHIPQEMFNELFPLMKLE